MSVTTASTVASRALLNAHRGELDALFAKYGAVNTRVFGSVARGDAGPGSDIDIMVDLVPEHPHSELMRISGLTVEVREVLGRDVDVFAPALMKERVSETALRDARRYEPHWRGTHSGHPRGGADHHVGGWP